MLFEELGLTYLGPFDGHNVPVMVNAINQAKKVKGPVLVHVLTKKGKGYFPAEKNPAKYHGIGCFDVKSGKEDAKDRIDYTAVFSNALLKLAASDERIVAITAAMASAPAFSAHCRYSSWPTSLGMNWNQAGSRCALRFSFGPMESFHCQPETKLPPGRRTAGRRASRRAS